MSLRAIDLMDLSGNRSPEQIREDWRRARTFLQEVLANGPLTEAVLFQLAAMFDIPETSLWGVLTNLPPCTVLRETRPDRRDPGRVWKLLR